MHTGDTTLRCTCMDFARSKLLCKHFFAIFDEEKAAWEDLPQSYLTNPYMTLDLKDSHGHGCSDEQTVHAVSVIGVSEQKQPAENHYLLLSTQRDMRESAKKLFDLSYTCPDITVIMDATEKLEKIGEQLKEQVPCELGLPLHSQEQAKDEHHNVKRQLPIHKKKW